MIIKKAANILFFSVILLMSCNKASDKKEIGELEGNKKWNTIVKKRYNANGKLCKEIIKSIDNIKGGKTIADKMLTKYEYYPKSGKLKRKIVLSNPSKQNSDSMITTYKYDHEERLIREVTIDYSGDTTEIFKKRYYDSNDEIEKVEEFLIKENIYSSNKEVRKQYDTSKTLKKIAYNDTLRRKIEYFNIQNGNKTYIKTTYYEYLPNGKEKINYTLDANNDTISFVKNKYDGAKIKRKVYINKKSGSISKSIYDEQGCINKIISIDKKKGEKDTTFYKCNEKGKVVEEKW